MTIGPQQLAHSQPIESARDFDDIYPLVTRIADTRAAAVARMCRLPHHVRADLGQDAVVLVWRRLPLFNPARASLKTFVEQIVCNGLRSSVRSCYALRRGIGKQESISEMKERLVAPDDCLDLRVDVRQVLAGVTAFDRAMAIALINYSPTEASNLLGVPRGSVYRSLVRLRAAFQFAGYSTGALGR